MVHKHRKNSHEGFYCLIPISPTKNMLRLLNSSYIQVNLPPGKTTRKIWRCGVIKWQASLLLLCRNSVRVWPKKKIRQGNKITHKFVFILGTKFLSWYQKGYGKWYTGWGRNGLTEDTELVVMLSEPLSMVVCSPKSVEKVKVMSVRVPEHCKYTVKDCFFLREKGL